MIRVERNPAFWFDVASHPQVAEVMGHYSAEQITAIISQPGLLPLAADHGGFLFRRCDGFGRVCELHTLFKPDGWGREVNTAAKEAFGFVFFTAGCQMVITYEMAANKHSRPPLSFGFVPIGTMEPSDFGEARSWFLTRDAWTSSPAGRKTCH